MKASPGVLRFAFLAAGICVGREFLIYRAVAEDGTFRANDAVVSNSLSVAMGEARGSGSLAHGFALATGEYAIALGYGAMALHDRTFVWSDGAQPPTFSTSPNQFLVHAAGGIHLLGGAIHGDGGGLTGLVGSNLLIGSIDASRLAPFSVTAGKLAPGAVGTTALALGVVGTGHVAAAEWNAWGDARFLNANGAETFTGSLAVSDELSAGRLSLRGALLQDAPGGNAGIEAPWAPVVGQANSVWVGPMALYGNSAGELNTAVGVGALSHSAGSYNSAFGAHTLVSVAGICNQAMGYLGGSWSVGSFNNSYGWLSGALADGSGNSAYGHASHQGSPGNYNTAVGLAANLMSAGDHNAAVGMNAGYAAPGSYNAVLGSYAMAFAPGGGNVAVGYAAGYKSTDGASNTFVGVDAGRGDRGTVAVTNSVALGAGAQVAANDTVVLGNPQQTVVIGGASAEEARFVVTPTGDLVVKGTVLMPHIMPLGDLSMGSYTNAP